MLNTDMALFYNLKLNDESEPTCDVPDVDHEEDEEGVCGRSKTYDQALSFADVRQFTPLSLCFLQ